MSPGLCAGITKPGVNMCNCACVRGRRCWNSLNKIKTHILCSVAHNLPFTVPLPLTPQCVWFWEWLTLWICTPWSQFGAKSRIFASTQFCTSRNWMHLWHHCSPTVPQLGLCVTKLCVPSGWDHVDVGAV